MKHITISILLIAFIAGCSESERYRITRSDDTPPASPVFLDAEPTPGGAKIFFQAPKVEDLLSVEATFTGANGKTLRFAASLFAEYLEVFGFSSEGEHRVELTAVDISGNRSAPVTATVTALEPPVVSIARSLEVFPSFGSIVLQWEDEERLNVVVTAELTYGQSGTRSVSFDSYNTERVTIDSLKLSASEAVKIKTFVTDMYGNTEAAREETFNLLVDRRLDKTGWSLPPAGTVIGGVTQANGSAGAAKMEYLIDELTEAAEPGNYYQSSIAAPWNVIIDLGQPVELSRIVTYQRYTYTDDSERGAYYRGDNVLRYNTYIFDEATQQWLKTATANHEIAVPTVKAEAEYKLLGDAGDEKYLYPLVPQFSAPTRYLRLEALNGKCISEITLWDAALSEDEIHRHEGLYPIDKSRWSILDYSAQYNAGTYSVNSLLRPYPSNGLGWETAINAVPKHYAIIDLGGRYNIGRIVSDRGYGEPYLKHYNWYISDSPTPPAESSSTWTLIGSGEHLGTTAAWGTSQALQFPEGVQGRYLKVQLIDGDGRYVVLIYCSVFEKR